MNKKQHVSVRVTETDHRKMKEIARRLGVKESDLFRFIIKNSLAKLLPFQDDSFKGTDLIPALLDYGSDLARYFDLDAEQLDRIVNCGVAEGDRRVDREDLDILALSGSADRYAVAKLSAITQAPVAGEDLLDALKDYFLGKYHYTFKLLQDLRSEPAPRNSTAIKSHQDKENQYA